ncbi:MAG TPA: cation diffusion facilitator family transporter [Candidatus Baltobacteraceae bacterium]|jgi:cobalt-zinc-cadmium efflux system protein|nr:cation diffusion facilitator family transporter [Candidatus Baltobacteraceae bacterium]
MARRRLVVALVLVAAVAALEFWGGLRANSLALLTDALHVCMDVFALGIALVAVAGSRRPATASKTFGYGRVEILAALINGSLLLAATGFIVYAAIGRFWTPYHSQGVLMMAFAAAGLIVNSIVGILLVRDSHHNLNVRAALFHVAGDALGAFAVIIGGAFIWLSGAAWIDPALSLFVAGIIVVGVFRVMRDATDVLLEGVPRDMRVEDVRGVMNTVPGIVDVHDLHVWTIGTGAPALSAHVLVEDTRVSEATAILTQVDSTLRERFGITHVTLQFECQNCEASERVVCTQPTQQSEATKLRRH